MQIVAVAQMFQLRISDSIDNLLTADLRHVLRAFAPEALDCSWIVSGEESQGEVWAIGEGAAELDDLARSGRLISGAELLEIADRTRQVIWGEFRGYREGHPSLPWMRIVAFDSTFYEVSSEDRAVLEKARSAFRETKLVSPP